MKLSIYSIQQTLYSGEAESVTLATPMGEITILDNHLPLISIVNPGEIRYISSGTKNAIKLPGGVVEVRPVSEVVILAESS